MFSDDNPANSPDSGVQPAPAASQPAPRQHEGTPPHSAPSSASAAAPHSEHHAPRTRPALREENTIFIGKKPTMGYVLAVVTQFQGGAPQVRIKARGQIISKAVDVAEIVRHKFLTETKLGPVSISTQEVENEDGTKSKVSCIEIVLLK